MESVPGAWSRGSHEVLSPLPSKHCTHRQGWTWGRGTHPVSIPQLRRHNIRSRGELQKGKAVSCIFVLYWAWHLMESVQAKPSWPSSDPMGSDQRRAEGSQATQALPGSGAWVCTWPCPFELGPGQVNQPPRLSLLTCKKGAGPSTAGMLGGLAELSLLLKKFHAELPYVSAIAAQTQGK